MERRQYPRVKTRNLISYIGFDPDGQIAEQNMGMALNLSQGGIFLETTDAICSESVSLMSVDAGDQLIEIKGRVVYSTQHGNGRFGAGVRFQGTHPQNIQFAMKLIKSFNAQKYKTAQGLNL